MTEKTPNFQKIFDNYLQKSKKNLSEDNNDILNNLKNDINSKDVNKFKFNTTNNKTNTINNITSNNINNKPIYEKVLMSVNKNGLILAKPSNKIIATFLSSKPNAFYNVKLNQWIFNVNLLDLLLQELDKNQVPCDKIPPGVIRLLNKPKTDHDFILSGPIYQCLMDFQRESVLFALNRSGRVLLADDMGLGKTVQALAIANYYALEFPMLIITPASLLHNWSESITRFLNTDSTIIRDKIDFGDKISIISYNLAAKYDSFIADKYGVIICDECHYLKSAATKRTKVLLPILQKAPRLIMISGTPAVSRPLELYTTIQAIDKSIFPSFNIYGMRYCNGKIVYGRKDFNGCSHAEELGYILEKEIMIRRTKEQVLSQLPKKFRRCVIIESKKEEKINKNFNIEFDSPDIMQLYREAVGLKGDSVIKYINELLEKNIKFLIFAHHQEMMDLIEKSLVDNKSKYIRIDGSITNSKRNTLVHKFQEDSNVRVALLSITACSTGLTLTAGKAVVFAELYWNPGTMMQAEDRIHRIGQNDNVDIHYLVCKGTVDERVWPKLIKKLNVLESLGIGNNELKLVSKEEVNQKRLKFKVVDFKKEKMEDEISDSLDFDIFSDD